MNRLLTSRRRKLVLLLGILVCGLLLVLRMTGLPEDPLYINMSINH
jgi:hypothetical protein